MVESGLSRLCGICRPAIGGLSYVWAYAAPDSTPAPLQGWSRYGRCRRGCNRRALPPTIREHGPDGVMALLQGKLGQVDVLLEAGLVVQPKVPKQAAEQAQEAA